MRARFISELVDIGTSDPSVWLLIADIGFGLVEAFEKECPDQFLNLGIAEQAIAGTAAGLAMSGKTPFFYSVGNFVTHRCMEQLRNDICYHGLDVKIVASGGGFAYGALGASHHVIDDLAHMRALPGMTVVAAGDPVGARLATRAIYDLPGPCYLRLGRTGEREIHPPDVPFAIGRAIRVRDGDAATLITTGGMLETAVHVADRLADEGLAARVVSMHTIQPIDADEIAAAATETAAIVTIEEHVLNGGLGGAVLEALADLGLTAKVTRIGIPNRFVRCAGSPEYLRSLVDLDPGSVLRTVRRALRGPEGPASSS